MFVSAINNNVRSDKSHGGRLPLYDHKPSAIKYYLSFQPIPDKLVLTYITMLIADVGFQLYCGVDMQYAHTQFNSRLFISAYSLGSAQEPGHQLNPSQTKSESLSFELFAIRYVSPNGFFHPSSQAPW